MSAPTVGGREGFSRRLSHPSVGTQAAKTSPDPVLVAASKRTESGKVFAAAFFDRVGVTGRENPSRPQSQIGEDYE